MIQKQVTIKLFFNLSNNTFYVQLGENLFMIKDKVAGAIVDKEGLEVRHGRDILDIQTMSNEDKNERHE